VIISKEILNDSLILESYQMDDKVDMILRILPHYEPESVLDNEEYIKLLFRNISPDTLQYLCYNLKVQKYTLIDSLLFKLIEQSLELPMISQLNFWKIVNSQRFECMVNVINQKVGIHL